MYNRTKGLHVVNGASVLAGVNTAKGELTVGDRLRGSGLEGDRNGRSGDRALALEIINH